MAQKIITFAVFTALLFGGFSVYAQCGSERTSVKSLSDSPKIDFDKVENSSIAELTALPEQKGDVPRRVSESRVVRITATLYGYKVESDGDYHLCLRDRSGKKMIAEIPNPKCPEASRSGHAKEYESARAWINNISKATKKFKKCNKQVVLTGIPMFDTHIHGQTGHAINDIEIHPVLMIQ